MNKFDVYLRTAQERLQSQEATAREHGTRAFQLVTIAGALLVAGLTLLGLSTSFPYEGDASSIAAIILLAILWLWILNWLRRAKDAAMALYRACLDGLWSRAWLAGIRTVRTVDLTLLMRRRGVTFAAFKRLAGRLAAGVWEWVMIAVIAFGAATVLRSSYEDLNSIPTVEIIAIVVMLGGFFFTAWLGVFAVFFKQLSRGPVPIELGEKICLHDPDDFSRLVGDHYSQAIESNFEVLSERGRLLGWSAMGLLMEVVGLLILGSCSLWRC